MAVDDAINKIPQLQPRPHCLWQLRLSLEVSLGCHRP